MQQNGRAQCYKAPFTLHYRLRKFSQPGICYFGDLRNGYGPHYTNEYTELVPVLDALSGFPKAGTASEDWSFGQGDRDGHYQPFRVRTQTDEGPSLSTESYPRVRLIEKGYQRRGTVYEPNSLLAHPAATRMTTFTDAVIRFTAPASGAYAVSLQAKAADLGYGGTGCRVIRGERDILASHYLPHNYGSHWEYSGHIQLAEKETLSLFVGPSANGDHASDETQVHFQLRSLSAWESLSAATSPWSVTGVALALLLAVVGTSLSLRARKGKLRSSAPPHS